MFDASAIIAYLRDEPGANEVEARLEDDSESCVAHAVNLCEVYYKAISFSSDEESAVSAIQDLKAEGLVVREDLDEAFWLEVGRYKANIMSLPLADCFVVALTNRLDAEAVTADHPDFDPIKERGICRVAFIR